MFYDSVGLSDHSDHFSSLNRVLSIIQRLHNLRCRRSNQTHVKHHVRTLSYVAERRNQDKFDLSVILTRRRSSRVAANYRVGNKHAVNLHILRHGL